MRDEALQAVEARHLVVPQVRALTTVFACIRRTLAEAAGEDAPFSPTVLKAYRASLGWLWMLVQRLVQDAGIEGVELQPLREQIGRAAAVHDAREAVGEVNLVTAGLSLLGAEHKSALRKTEARSREMHRALCRELVGPVALDLLHRADDAQTIDNVARTLSGRCFYDVERRQAGDLAAPAAGETLALAYGSSPAGVADDLRLVSGRRPIDLVLIDLGRKLPVTDLGLARVAHQLAEQGVAIAYSPFTPIRLLQSVERIRVARL